MADSVVQKNARDLFYAEFAQYGLSGQEFLDSIMKIVNDNTDALGNVANATVASQIRATPQYQQRFAGNIIRQNAIKESLAQGKIPSFGTLSEADYVKVEDSYRDILKGKVPPNFYEDNASLAKLIGNDISTNELSGRVNLAQQAASQANPEIKQQLASLYGIQENQIAAYFLDPTVAQQSISAIAAGNSAIVAAAAQRSGINIDRQQAEAIATNNQTDVNAVLSAKDLFGQVSQTSGLATGDVSGMASTVTGQDVLAAATGDAEKKALLEKERQKRQAEYAAASGMAETQKGVVGLQRANL
jgi:hypothetical protein